MTEKLPPTPYEPPWWDGISFKTNMTTVPETPPWRAPTRAMIDEAAVAQEYVSASKPSRLIAYITIGNSDDKLNQQMWSTFIRDLKELLTDYAGQQHGEWYSAPDARWQNMCICKEIELEDLDRLRAALCALRHFYRQDSVALVTSGRTELV